MDDEGGPKGGFGYLITDEAPSADQLCRFNDLTNAAIYGTAAKGAHLVYGEIYKRGVALGSEPNPGFPAVDERIAGHGRLGDFSLSSIYWFGQTHAHILIGEIRARFQLSVALPARSVSRRQMRVPFLAGLDA